MNKQQKAYMRLVDGKCVQTARLKLLGIGKFAFETSIFGKPYELNMNMPLFDTEKAAIKWMDESEKWVIQER